MVKQKIVTQAASVAEKAKFSAVTKWEIVNFGQADLFRAGNCRD